MNNTDRLLPSARTLLVSIVFLAAVFAFDTAGVIVLLTGKGIHP